MRAVQRDRTPVDLDRTGGGPVDARKDLDQRALAGAIVAKQRQLNPKWVNETEELLKLEKSFTK